MELKKFDELNENNSDGFKLKDPMELQKLIESEDKSELYKYFDLLHMYLKDYQLIIDMAISKNKNFYS